MHKTLSTIFAAMTGFTLGMMLWQPSTTLALYALIAIGLWANMQLLILRSNPTPGDPQ